MNDGYNPWYRVWRVSLWLLHTLTGGFAVVGVFVLMYLLLQSTDLRWMVWFLPIWFLAIFLLVLTGHFVKWGIPRDDDEQ